MRLVGFGSLFVAAMLATSACGTSESGTGGKHAGASSSSASVTAGVGGATALKVECASANPPTVDTDGDGISDCDEIACGSDPYDASEVCATCGWRDTDPGTLMATGSKVGDVIDNLSLIDQCKEKVPLWNFAGEYHILFMTAAW